MFVNTVLRPASMMSGPRGIAEEKESMSVQERVAGEGTGVFLERIPGGDKEEVNLRAAGGDVVVGSRE